MKLIFLLAAWLALGGLAHVRAAPPAAPPRTLIAKLGRSGLNLLWLEATIENVKGKFIVDTGANSSMLGEDKYHFLLRGPDHKLPSGVPAMARVNTSKARVVLARDFHLGGKDLGSALMRLVPERYLTEGETFHYQNRASDFDGIMGEDFLRHYQAIVDCSRQLLYLNLGPARKPEELGGILNAHGWTRVPMSDDGNDFTVPCLLKGRRFRLLVDTGSAFTTVDQKAVQAIGVGSRDLPFESGLIGNDSSQTALVHLHDIQIGGFTATDVQMTALENLLGTPISAREMAAVDPLVGTLGADTLAFNGAIIDIGGRALYLKHPPGNAKKP